LGGGLGGVEAVAALGFVAWVGAENFKGAPKFAHLVN